MVELRGVTSPLTTETAIVLQTIRMPKVAPDGNAMDNIRKKIEQLELEQSQLMNTTRMNTDQMDKFTRQIRDMSDQDGPLDESQTSVRSF